MYEGIRIIRGGRHVSEGKYRHITRDSVPSAELILVTGGVLYMSVGEAEYTVSPGQVLRILPGERHGGTQESDGVEFIWMHFLGANEAILPPVISTPQSFHRVVLLARETLHYLESTDYPPECADNLARVMLCELCHEDRSADSTVWSVKRLVRKKDGVLTAGECAMTLGYSEDYLNRYFKSRVGVSLKKYIDGVRLDSAKQRLLTENTPLSVLASELGFSDYKSFLKFFKYHLSMTPKEYKSSIYKLKEN